MADAQILEVAERLGARLRRVGPNERAGPCPKCGGRDRFSINVAKGLWNCRGCGVGGDAIALAQHILDCGFREALEFTGDERRLHAKPHAPARPVPVPAQPAPDLRAREMAEQIVSQLAPVRSSPGEAYLREARGIDTSAIVEVLERTDAIGWHPRVYFHDPDHPLHGQRIGALIAVMMDPVTAKPTGAVSRTYVSEGRKVGKAKTLGSPAGLVRLSLDEDVLEGLHLAEGLESALYAMALGFRPIWSTGSTAHMAKLPALKGVESLTIFADHDVNGAGEKAAREAEARWRDAGREVRILRLKEPGDINDAGIRRSA